MDSVIPDTLDTTVPNHGDVPVPVIEEVRSTPQPVAEPVVTTNPKDRLGLAKPGFTAIPPSALLFLGQAMQNGREKYGLMNWRDKEVLASVYVDAGLRHRLSWWDGEDEARDSLIHHLAHSMACDAILLDAIATGKLVDDRPARGTFAELITKYTKV